MAKVMGGLLAGGVAYAIARRLAGRQAPRPGVDRPLPEDARVTAARLIG